ncbi:class I SAM-dependent methyltransferase [Sandaracinus amylolyticus]|uniref:class I SAM-dependent methyltransferase n=1 Tax=Sandaracinus amylolyticus TaxID=927083 RepID=UPI001F37DA51|nr:class I SAM-dependent methyltransferase [Sandaracinus amylolyticus]UJR81413.1 Ubiquinone biosynthesis O-methyltransferase [Sandaracinus amylolyticus]
MDGSVARTEPGTRAGTRCPICQGERHRPVFGATLPWVVECEQCHLRFADPQPSDDQLGAIYDEHYYEQFGFVEGPHSSDAALARTKKATYASVLDVAEPALRSDGRRLLDVGCGLGFSLLAAQERGFDAVGIDPLAPADPAARPGRRVLSATLETFTPDAPLDVVSMIDVIEHVRDPVATLRRAAELLAPGGVIALATNDSSSLGARVLGPRWTHYHRAHLWFFTPASLSDVARRAGLEVVLTAPARRTYNLEYIASILARGTNFDAAAKVARVALAIAPERVKRAAWPPVSEGFVLVARRAPNA